jgi:hypothetical protein
MFLPGVCSPGGVVAIRILAYPPAPAAMGERAHTAGTHARSIGHPTPARGSWGGGAGSAPESGLPTGTHRLLTCDGWPQPLRSKPRRAIRRATVASRRVVRQPRRIGADPRRPARARVERVRQGRRAGGEQSQGGPALLAAASRPSQARLRMARHSLPAWPGGSAQADIMGGSGAWCPPDPRSRPTILAVFRSDSDTCVAPPLRNAGRAFAGRPRLRPRQVPPPGLGSRREAGHRPPGHRARLRTRHPTLGRGTRVRPPALVPPPADPLGDTRRHPRSLPHPRMRTHLLATPALIPIRSFTTACGAGEILLDRRTAVRGALPLREEVVRPQRTTKRQRQGGYALLATLNV